MRMKETAALLVFCTVAFSAVPASARDARPAGEGLTGGGPRMEITEFSSARRKHHARRHASRPRAHARHRSGYRVARHLRGAPAGEMMPSALSIHDLPTGKARVSAAMGYVQSAPNRTMKDAPVRPRRIASHRHRRSVEQRTHQHAASPAAAFAAVVSSPGNSLVAEARRYLGTNPTGRSRLWCARFMNMVLERSGHKGTSSDMARSFASYGQRLSGPQVGAIAVMTRGRRGGHVGVVSGFDPKGNPVVISGNHSRRVAESVYSRSRVYAYVIPNG
jgi:uncharacterized protein (TIGR02594 family)